MEDEKEFSAGRPDFAPRSQLAPWHQDPRAMFRTVAGLAGAPGMSQAGMGMLGGLARAVDPAEKMFRAAGPAALGMLGIGSAAAGELQPQRRVNPALEKYGPQEMDQSIKIGVGPYGAQPGGRGGAYDITDITTLSDEKLAEWAQGNPHYAPVSAARAEIQRRMQLRGEELQRMRGGQKRSGIGMLEQIARAPAPRPSGAGDRRDKRLRDAEDADTKTS